MNPLEIEAFLAITETRNLSKAADKLFVSQSTISSRLTNLESEIGSPLVNRRPRNQRSDLNSERQRIPYPGQPLSGGGKRY